MKIVVGGALNKKENAELIEKYGNGQVEVVIMQDIQAALALKNGQADYYFGSCQTCLLYTSSTQGTGAVRKPCVS